MRQWRLVDQVPNRTALALCVLGGVVLLGREASADGLPEDAALSVQHHSRPLTLPAGTLRVDGDIGATRLDLGDRARATWSGLGVGAALGLADDLMVFAEALPLRLSPELDYGDPDIGVVYRLTRGALQVGAGFALGFYDTGASGRKFNFDFGVPVLARLGRWVRLDTGLALGILTVDDYVLAFLAPVGVAVQATDDFFVGLRTGLAWHDLRFADTAYSPLGAFAGYTMAGTQGRPLVDFVASFDFPAFLGWGSDYGGETVTGLWSVALSARFFVDLRRAPPSPPGRVGADSSS